MRDDVDFVKKDECDEKVVMRVSCEKNKKKFLMKKKTKCPREKLQKVTKNSSSV